MVVAGFLLLDLFWLFSCSLSLFFVLEFVQGDVCFLLLFVGFIWLNTVFGCDWLFSVFFGFLRGRRKAWYKLLWVAWGCSFCFIQSLRLFRLSNLSQVVSNNFKDVEVVYFLVKLKLVFNLLCLS